MSPSEVAKKYLGKTEKPGNQGFHDVEFERRMKEVGFSKGQAWCAYWVELIFKESYPELSKKLDTYFNASTVKTFQNFKEAGYTISSTPLKDSLVVWQTQRNGKPHWTGHCAVVTDVIDETTFYSIEGNTIPDNKTGSSRECYIVAKKLRKVRKVKNGLQVLGFIKIP